MKISTKQINAALGLILLFICLCGFSGFSQKPAGKDTVRSILFIGNSLTYTNDLPNLVVRKGGENGILIKTEMLAFPNYGLEDHWNDGNIQILISVKKYDFVIIQQGPSSQNDGRIMLIDYGARINTLCQKNKSKLVYFMVWPGYSHLQSFDGVIKNYSDAAKATNALLCPVGQVWKKHFEETKEYSYYGPDMFHPSQKGSEIAAQIIFETLFK